ncbi:acyltransferase [Pseudomonas rhizosphaerae]|uniref:Acyltransferase n=1 Tax=Pseudomonas rhizosphaerae TaxID=216142 RepID=A0A089ZRA2_9PSED|nr:acyltransferase family protein [Pseudomonas rhizosphaerae]AIS19026.1 acyltransferase [Pseudomonas rhizosphaerae]
MNHLAYRRDIDGLRAVAVIAVVLFHFGIPGFAGGFVGVDVFFVISGYLITSIICRERASGHFSFVAFWVRRARRILPALVVMVVACLVVGWFLLVPRDYEELGRSARYQAMFISNVLFARQDGYFDTDSELKPLLHTWSLAVEEQFYILLPLLLALLGRYVKAWRRGLLGIALVSLAVSLWQVQHASAQAFFLLPARAWELLAGSLLAVAPVFDRAVSSVVRHAVATAGIAAVAVAIACYDWQTAFPGMAALLPVLGTVAIIWSGSGQGTWLSRMLGTRPMVAVGLISYSWYLWHWPVHVFAEYAAVDGIAMHENLALMLCSLLLGYLSWRWVETPMRGRRWLAQPRQALLGALLAMVLVGLAGQSLRWSEGVPWRLSTQALGYANASQWHAGQRDCMFEAATAPERLICHFGPRGDEALPPLVWGDSHAAALIPALRVHSEHTGQALDLASSAGCIPVAGLERNALCRQFNAQVRRVIAQAPRRDVVLVARWTLYLYGDEHGDLTYRLPGPDTSAQMADALKREVQALRQGGSRVWLLDEVPLQSANAPYRLSRLAMLERPTQGVGRSLSEHRQRQAFMHALFAELAAGDPQVRILDTTRLFCADGITCVAEAAGHSLYMDDNHLGDDAARFVAPLFAPLLSPAKVTGQGNSH